MAQFFQYKKVSLATIFIIVLLTTISLYLFEIFDPTKYGSATWIGIGAVVFGWLSFCMKFVSVNAFNEDECFWKAKLFILWAIRLQNIFYLLTVSFYSLKLFLIVYSASTNQNCSSSDFTNDVLMTVIVSPIILSFALRTNYFVFFIGWLISFSSIIITIYFNIKKNSSPLLILTVILSNFLISLESHTQNLDLYNQELKIKALSIQSSTIDEQLNNKTYSQIRIINDNDACDKTKTDDKEAKQVVANENKEANRVTSENKETRNEESSVKEQSDKEMRHMVGNVAHDLKTVYFY
jgi:hypothetical protein